MGITNTEVKGQYVGPKSCGHSRETIERAGIDFAKHYKFTATSDLDEIVKMFGGQLRRFQEPGCDSQCSIEIPPDFPREAFTIHLNPFPSPETDRFGVAHELGHFVLHYLVPRKNNQMTSGLRADFHVESADDDQMIAELEADWFAYGFLLDQHAVEQALSETGNEPDAVVMLATRYGVPSLVAFERIRSVQNLK